MHKLIGQKHCEDDTLLIPKISSIIFCIFLTAKCGCRVTVKLFEVFGWPSGNILRFFFSVYEPAKVQIYHINCVVLRMWFDWNH